MKKEIIQTLKIIIAGIILSAGIALAQTWNSAPAAPPSSNTYTPINISETLQQKEGALFTGPLAIFGNSALNGDVSIDDFLYVSGKFGIGVPSPSEKVEVDGSIKTYSLKPDATQGKVCVDTSGTLVLCPVFNALIITTSNSGSKVTSADGAIDCGAGGTSCLAFYAPDTSITLTADPDSGYVLSGWGVAGSGYCEYATCTFDMPSYDLEMDAIFVSNSGSGSSNPTLIVKNNNSSGTNSGNTGVQWGNNQEVTCNAVTCSYSIANGTSITITAYSFSSAPPHITGGCNTTPWPGDTTSSCTFQMGSGSTTVNSWFGN